MDIMFCGGGGGGGGGGVSRSTVLPLCYSGVPGKVPGGICPLYCWLEGGLSPKTCSILGVVLLLRLPEMLLLLLLLLLGPLLAALEEELLVVSVVL